MNFACDDDFNLVQTSRQYKGTFLQYKKTNREHGLLYAFTA